MAINPTLMEAMFTVRGTIKLSRLEIAIKPVHGKIITTRYEAILTQSAYGRLEDVCFKMMKHSMNRGGRTKRTNKRVQSKRTNNTRTEMAN